MTTKPGDIGAVDEVLGWDPRGDAEEYELLEKAQEAFSRIKRELRELRKSRKESVEKYDELFRMTEGYIKRLHKVEASLKCAEERGAKWALERQGNPFANKTLAQYAEEICEDERRPK